MLTMRFKLVSFFTFIDLTALLTYRTMSYDVVRHRASRHPALSYDVDCAVWTPLKSSSAAHISSLDHVMMWCHVNESRMKSGGGSFEMRIWQRRQQWWTAEHLMRMTEAAVTVPGKPASDVQGVYLYYRLASRVADIQPFVAALY